MNGTKQDLIKHCSPIRLQEYLDDELPNAEAAIVDRHLFECTDCKTELNNHISLFANINLALENSFRLPAGFADVVVANANRQLNSFYTGFGQMIIIILVAAILSIFAIITSFGVAELIPLTARSVAVWKAF